MSAVLCRMNAMKTVYRVEDEKGVGPYRITSGRTKAQKDLAIRLGVAHKDESHPTPDKEGINQRLIEIGLCGFENLENLYDWFDGWLDELRETGHVIRAYDVEDVLIWRGEKQVVFLYGDAKEQMPL